MEHTSLAASKLRNLTTRRHDELFGFRDSATGIWLKFYRPMDRFDLWKAYVAGVTRTYQQFQAEKALKLPLTAPSSTTPIFVVATDKDDKVVGGWYANGPLTTVKQAYAPAEFAADPISATLIAEWISRVRPEGAIELKAGWVDGSSPLKNEVADVIGRSVIHAMRVLGVTHAFATAAEHAARRWSDSGGRPMPGIAPTPYPDNRYSTFFYSWHAHTAVHLAAPAQRKLFFLDLQSTSRTLAGDGVAR